MALAEISPSSSVMIHDGTVTFNDFCESDPTTVKLLSNTDDPVAKAHTIFQLGSRALSDATDSVTVDKVGAQIETMVSALKSDANATSESIMAAVADAERAFRGAVDTIIPALTDCIEASADPDSESFILGALEARFNDVTNAQITEITGRLANAVDGHFEKSGARVIAEVHRMGKAVSDDVRAMSEKFAVDDAREQAESEVMAKSTMKGFAFEEVVFDAVTRLSAPYGDLVEHVAKENGITGSQKGDLTIDLDNGPDLSCNARIVVEAKTESMGTRALNKYLDDSLINRGGDAVIAVFDRQEAAPTNEPFTWHGNKFVCVYDGDIADESALKAALYAARYIASRAGQNTGNEDIDAERVDVLLQDMGTQLARFAKVKGAHTKSRKALDEADSLVNDMQSELQTLVDNLTVELNSIPD